MIKYAIAEGDFAIVRLANAPFAPERILGSAETASSVGKVLIALSGSGFDRHDDRRPPVGSGVENVEFALLARSGRSPKCTNKRRVRIANSPHWIPRVKRRLPSGR